jgi:hypothetical protein
MSTVFAEGTPLIRLALGKGKYAKTQFSLATYKQVVDALKGLPPEISKKYQSAALKRAAKPGERALQTQVSRLGQVTGNLLASVTTVKREYDNSTSRTPVGVAVVGFRRPVGQKRQKGSEPAFSGGGVLRGPNRAYHSHLVEFGTRPKTPGIKTGRRANVKRVMLGGRIRTQADRIVEFSGASRRVLSSGFRDGGEKKGKRRQFTGRGQYPIDFIATGTVAGSKALRPLANAFAASKGKMQSLLDSELRRALRLASAAYAKKYGEVL